MRRHLPEFFRRCAIVERVDHIRPGGLIEGRDQLCELFRVLAPQIPCSRRNPRHGRAVSNCRSSIASPRFCNETATQPSAVIGPVGPAFVILLMARCWGLGIPAARIPGSCPARLGGLAVRHFESRHAGEIEQSRHHRVDDMAELAADCPAILSFSGHETTKLTRLPPPPV